MDYLNIMLILAKIIPSSINRIKIRMKKNNS